jgi:hypothetical protein
MKTPLIVAAIAAFSLPAFADVGQFQHGLADGIAWRQWTATLIPYPEKHDGADYWAGERSKPNPGSCYINSPDFQQSCLEAKRRLDPTDILRKSQPDYRAGWNSAFSSDVVIPDGYVPTPAPEPSATTIAAQQAADRARAKAEAAQAETARIVAENGRKLAELRQQQIEAEAAAARRKAESDKAEQQLRYQERKAAQIQKEKDLGYKPIEFEDFALDKRDLAAASAKIAIEGYYLGSGENAEMITKDLIPSAIASREDHTVNLLTDGADRGLRKYFLECRNTGNPCPITVLGKVVSCKTTNRSSGAESNTICLKVDDGWHMGEPTS